MAFNSELNFKPIARSWLPVLLLCRYPLKEQQVRSNPFASELLFFNAEFTEESAEERGGFGACSRLIGRK